MNALLCVATFLAHVNVSKATYQEFVKVVCLCGFGTGGARGAHQDVGEDPHDMEEGGHRKQEEEGPTETLVPVQG